MTDAPSTISPSSLNTADADRILASIGEGPKPRDEAGRFVSDKPAPEQPQAPEQAPESAQADAAPAETQPSGDTEEQADTEVAPPAVEPPASWNAAEIEHFKSLPPEAQAAIARRERDRDVEIRRVQDEAAREKSQAQSLREQYQAQLNQVVPALAQQAQNQWASVDWVKLGAEQPAEYARLRPMFERDMQQLAFAQQEQARLQEQSRQEMAGKLQNWLQEQERELLTSIPSWKDEKVGRAELSEIQSYLKGQGIPAEAVNSLADAKQIQIARKAMLYDKAQSRIGKPAATATPPRVQKPGTSDPERPVTQQRQEQWNSFRKSGHLSDAAAILKNIL